MSQTKQLLRAPGRRFGRNQAEHGLDNHGHLDHELAVLFVSFGIHWRMARDFTSRARVVAAAVQIVAIGHRRECAIERNDFEIVSRELELAYDFRPKKTNNIGTYRILKAWINLFSD